MIDPLDLKILALYQHDTRTVAEAIGQAVGLSASAVQRRLKHLRESGHIRAEVAHEHRGKGRRGRVAEIEHAVAAGALTPVPCHNDLLCENFIDDGDMLRIVDYELSGNNDPCFDLGNTAQEALFGEDRRAALCEAYFGKVDPQQLARMNLFALMSDIGWTLWGAIQAKISAIDYDFRGYYSERWARAVGVLESDRFPVWLREALG